MAFTAAPPKPTDPGNAAPRPVSFLVVAGRSLWQAWSLVLFYLMLVLFGVSCLLWSLPAIVLGKMLPLRLGRPLGRFMIMAGFRYYLTVLRLTGFARTDLSALDGLRHERRLLIAVNHPSLMDAVLVISRLPRVTCIMKAAIIDNPFLGGGARLAGYLRNDSALSLAKQATAGLRTGDQLLVFPEGTRTAAPPIGGFKGGFALIARMAGAPVQTVFLESNSGFLGKGWPLFRRPSLPVIYRARLGRRFEVAGSAQAFTAELEAYFREELTRRDEPTRPERSPSAPCPTP